jgi:hypothetical protein
MNDPHKVSDAVGRTALFRIGQLWQARFGRELQGHSEVVAWLCTDFNMEATDAENLPLDVVADLLSMDDAALAERLLTNAERDILFAFNEGDVFGSKEIAARAGRDADTVRDCLRPSARLIELGFIVKGKAGYSLGRRKPQRKPK